MFQSLSFSFDAVWSLVGSLSSAAGSAVVRIGSTTVAAAVICEFAVPSEDAPNRGFIGMVSLSVAFSSGENLHSRSQEWTVNFWPLVNSADSSCCAAERYG